MRYFVVQCSDEKHPACGATHIWYYDQPSDKWCIKDGTPFGTKEEAERVAFSLACRYENQIKCIGVIGEEDRICK